MHIGIVPRLEPSAGGLHQYTLAILGALAKLGSRELRAQYTVFLQPGDEEFLLQLRDAGWRQTSLKPPSQDRVPSLSGMAAWLRDMLRGVGHRSAPPPSRPESNQIQDCLDYARWFRHHGVDWVLYTAPNRLSFETSIPYVMPVHDLQHRLQPEFPEVSANGEWEGREHLFRNGIRHATLILANSQAGKEDILECYGVYGVTPDRVKVLPYLPAPYLATDVGEAERHRVRARYGLPERYLFYPAQFWPHKNHARIIQAIGQLKRTGREVHIVFCGDYADEIRKRTFEEVMLLTRHLDLTSLVRYLGYVPNEDMAALYAEAVGLVMPTFFGPANIPVLEAWALGCPVLTSDLRGIREQVGDAGLLVDPRSIEAIREGIHRIWGDEALRQTLAQRGRQRGASYTPQDFQQRLAGIIREAGERVSRKSGAIFAASTYPQR